MKIRRSLFWFTVICVVLMVLVVWLGRKPAETPLPTVAGTNGTPPATASVAAKASQQNVASIRTNAPVATATPGARPSTQPLKTKGDQMKEALAEFNDEDVVLYGKVIDQFGAPVANANVAGSIQVNNGTRVGTDKVALATDANGMFTVSGYRGKALGIWVTKKGYVMATTSTSFVYSHLWSEGERYNPDPTIQP